MVVTVCNQRLYLLAQLKRQGLDLSALDSVFNAIIANKILYALPVHYGYLTQGHKEMFQRENFQKSQPQRLHCA